MGRENMLLILCTLAVSYVSAAPLSADNIGVNKSTVLPSSFVISGTHNASINGFCKIRPDVCGNWWSEFPSGYGHPDPADCVKDPQQCHNEAVKIVAAAPVSATQECDATHRECTEDRECRKDPGCDDWQCFMGTDHRGTCAQDAVDVNTPKAVVAQCGGFCTSNAECWKKGPGCGS